MNLAMLVPMVDRLPSDPHNFLRLLADLASSDVPLLDPEMSLFSDKCDLGSRAHYIGHWATARLNANTRAWDLLRSALRVAV